MTLFRMVGNCRVVVRSFEKFGLLPGLCDQHCVINFVTCMDHMIYSALMK